jgi:hypothetical protein
MLFTAIFILFFIGGRAIFLYKQAKTAGENADYLKTRRICLCTFIPACSMLILYGYLALSLNAFMIGHLLGAGLVATFWGLLFFGFLYVVIRLPKDGWILRGILIGIIVLSLAWSGVVFYINYRDISLAEQSRFQNNFKRCAELIDQGKRKLLAEELQNVSTRSLQTLNDDFEAAIKKIEGQK